MKYFFFFIFLVSNFSFAKPISITLQGSEASDLLESYQNWVKVHPAYEKTLQKTIYCKLKAPKKREWGYAGCTNEAWYSYGDKTTSYLTKHLIEALPEDLQETLLLTEAEKKNKYIGGITVESVICEDDYCEVIYDPENQDRSHLEFF